MPKNITESDIQRLENIIFKSLQYGKLMNSPYSDYLDMDKYRSYIHDVFSEEAMWYDISTNDIGNQEIGRAHV